MNTIKNAAVSTKQFVVRHKVAVAVAATSVVWYKLQRSAIEGHDNFLKEHGLYEKFYTPEA